MAGLFFQPQTPDYRGLWDWNPAQTFITAKNELEAADLRRAESDRLRKKDEIDAAVTQTMLPLKVREAEANIALAQAGVGLRAAQANYYGSGGVRALNDRTKMFEAASDPDAANKGRAILGRPSSSQDSPDSDPASNNLIPEDTTSSSFDLSNLGQESDHFLNSIAPELPNPATSLSNSDYAISKTPAEMSANANGGAEQLPQATKQDVANIKTLARSGDATAKDYVNPLGESKSSNPLDDFNVDPSSAIRSTLYKNANAFAPAKKEAAPAKTVQPSLGRDISEFKAWDDNAQRQLRLLQKTNPAAFVQATLAYNEEQENFRNKLGSSYDSDEVNWLLRNASRADRYAGYKKAGLEPEESAFLSKMNPGQADAILGVYKGGKLPDGTPVGAVNNLDEAKAIYNDAVRRGVKPTKETDAVERATKAQSLIDAISKKENRTDEDEMALEKLGVERDAALQLPQGASKLGGQLNRYFRQNQQLEEARNAGLGEFEGVTADQFDAQIASNMNKIQAIAIKYAPSFKNSAERDAWFQSEETRNLPFKMSIGGKPTVVYRTEDPNVVTSYIANGKKGPEWVTHSLVQKNQEPEKLTESNALKTDPLKSYVPEKIQSNLTAASSAKEKLDKMWTGGFAVSPDKAKREEYAATKEELNENLAPVYAQIRKLEQEVQDSGYPNFKGDPSLNKERLRQINELRKQIPLGHRLGKELLGLGKPAAKTQPNIPQPSTAESSNESNPLLQNWEGILKPRTQGKGMENVGFLNK